MPYKPKEVEGMLQSKLKMVRENRDHRWLRLEVEGLPPLRTKVSHNNKTIGDNLEKRMYNQLRVRKPFFHELMDCTKNRDEYIKQIREDPYPTWDVLIL